MTKETTVPTVVGGGSQGVGGRGEALSARFGSSRPGSSPAVPENVHGLGHWMRTAGWRHAVAIVAVAFALFPMVFVLSSSLNPRGSLTDASSMFSTVSLRNYLELFRQPRYPYAWWYLNSLVIGVTVSAGSLLLAASAAYAFSRFRFRGRRTGLMSLILLQMFPQVLAYVAIFLMLSTFTRVFPAIGLDRQLGLILLYMGGALGTNTYLMYGFFNTIPHEIDEAAMIDGAGHARIFFTIILRLSLPILVVTGMLSFIATLNDYMIPSIVLITPERQTLAVGLYQYVNVSFSQNWGVFSAGAVLAAVPVVVMFMFLQKYIVSGLTAGSVKG
ncbi:ABC-type transporter, integral membrane subunit [Bifidobacterium minimum]|uniref:ABC-type transporter, integral membrane subunit n=1 Tax=Bifidobacterium minimum TaxID=1693 RepID=A0A087BMQ5_9BIFI|nr:ABC transporter permease subunit [Bifidobacterium minimum]KFI72305.1 ABC-type transporter, integral membrane subunit [Bifidobacterium minimum]MCH4159531.1 ABC transporter permease subunit [Bifidobacterium minimum]